MDLLEEKLKRKNIIETADECVDTITSRLAGITFERSYLKSYVIEAIDNSEREVVIKKQMEGERGI